MKRFSEIIVAIFLSVAWAYADGSQNCAETAIAAAAKKSQWNGFTKYDMTVEGKNAIFVAPKKPRSNGAWILRPAFFGAFANADVELLNRGFFIAYFDLTHSYATPNAMKLADKFYERAVKEFGLSKRVALEGLSRGGACALAWANCDPLKIAAVYVDAPVCDFLVWPCQKSEKLKADFIKKWNIKSLENFKGSPIDRYENLAHSGVPVLIVAGDSDKTVPFESNGAIYKKRFENAGGKITLIIKKGCDHHPHGLADPKPITDFIESAYSKIGK